MKTNQEYAELVKFTAYQMRAMVRFDAEPEHIRAQLRHATVQEFLHFGRGEQVILDGGDLTRDFVEPVEEPPLATINTPAAPEVPDTGEQDSAV